MGVGSSQNPESGVSLNPRVAYARWRAHKDRKDRMIDAPVLMKLGDGTVRYRVDNEASKCEKPHEGPRNLDKKTGYFYHARLNDFSQDASYHKEEPWKFYYVTRGPNNTNKKKLHYVFGKGMNHPNPQNGLDVNFKWPSAPKAHGHVHYEIHFLAQSEELAVDNDQENVEFSSSDFNNPRKRIEFVINKDDNIDKLKTSLSNNILKSTSQIQLFHQGQELKSTDVIGDLRGSALRHWKNFKIILEPK